MTEPLLPPEIARLTEKVSALRMAHHISDDCWYSCPKAPSDFREGSACCNSRKVEAGECTCGADQHNAKVEEIVAILAALHAAREEPK